MITRKRTAVVSTEYSKHMIKNEFCEEVTQATASFESVSLRKVSQQNSDVFSKRVSELQSSELPVIGQVIGGHLLLRELGRGGMGIVYLAQEFSSEKLVALKVLQPKLADDPVQVEQFRYEAELLHLSEHPLVAKFYSFGYSNQFYYIAMEYVEGSSLLEWIQRSEDSDFSSKTIFLQSLFEVVSFLHEMNIVHCDLKPANILIDENGLPKLIDFGLAYHLESIEADLTSKKLAGTPHYIAPERLKNTKLRPSEAFDIYALGVIFYQLLTGSLPYHGSTALEVLKEVLVSVPVAPKLLDQDIPSYFSFLCMKCLEKEPSKRPSSVRVLMDSLAFYHSDPCSMEQENRSSNEERVALAKDMSFYNGPTEKIDLAMFRNARGLKPSHGQMNLFETHSLDTTLIYQGEQSLCSEIGSLQSLSGIDEQEERSVMTFCYKGKVRKASVLSLAAGFLKRYFKTPGSVWRLKSSAAFN